MWRLLLHVLLLLCWILLSVGADVEKAEDFATAIYPHLEERFIQLAGTEINGSCLVVLPIGHFGLANRLRTISSVYAVMRRQCQRRTCSLLVAWNIDDQCSAPFDSLFKLRGDTHVDVIDSNITSLSGSIFRDGILIAMQHLAAVYGVRGAALHLRDFHVEVDFEAVELLLLKTIGTHASPLHQTSCREYLNQRREFYDLLSPSNDIDGILRSMVKKYFAQSSHLIVGVHLRAFNGVKDWPVVPPHFADAANDDASSQRFDEAAPLWSFEQLLKYIQLLQSNVRFFVASNSQAAVNHLVGFFGEESVLHVAAEAHSSTIAAAVIDFFLLGETSLIIHTIGSSFGREAGMRKLIPVIDVAAAHSPSRHFSFFSMHSQLPFCAMPEYIRAQRKDNTSSVVDISGDVVVSDVDTAGIAAAGNDSYARNRFCYLDDSRRMCTLAYLVCPCDRLQYELQSIISLTDSDPILPVAFCTINISASSAAVDELMKSDEYKFCHPVIAESNAYSI